LNTQPAKCIVQETQRINKKKEPFKPFKTTKTNVHDPMKEKQRKLPTYWENTAATPPHIINDPIKILDYDEAWNLQQEQFERRNVQYFQNSFLISFKVYQLHMQIIIFYITLF